MRILFIGPTYIGDAAIATGLVGHLADRHPEARFTIAIGATALPVYAGLPGLERLIPLVKRRRLGHWLDLWRDTVGTRWDLVVDLRGSLTAWVLWTRHRRIYRRDRVHHSSVAWARVLGLDLLPPPRLWLTPEASAAAAALLPAEVPLVLGPTGRYGFKLWRPERWAALARRLTAAEGPLPGAPVVLLGAAHERALTDPIRAALADRRIVDLVSRTDLPAAMAVIARAGLFLGVDSGLLYLATAAGVPTVGLVGPTSTLFQPPAPPPVAAPWAPHVALARAPVDAAAIATAAARAAAAPQLDPLTVDAVEDVARALMTRLGRYQ